MKLLLSEFALRTWGPRIAAAAGDIVFVTAEQALATDGPSDVDIAFMTREVTGKSSPGNPTPDSIRWCGSRLACAGCRSIPLAPSGRSTASFEGAASR